ncbi:hypothetical protein Dda_3070 [Drechslerella dactyloides]|uniref:Uncharacterized protein n=1 Tax=Drechslerella dactyloides TaxID=74499 RepID=A0AAD6J278_DREDA|nr:hypothetical protein Dda_3070 [Drechslerella dactyloides]
MLEVLLPSLAPHPATFKSQGAPISHTCGGQRSDIYHLSDVLSAGQFSPINVNIKMLPILRNNMMNAEGAAQGSSSADEKQIQPVSKLIIPSKEKFLVGFRGFDAPVGLPESPTEYTLSEADVTSPIALPLKRSRSESLPVQHIGQAAGPISELQLAQPSTAGDASYVADGFRPRADSAQGLPSYDAIYGALGSNNVSTSSIVSLSEAAPLPTKRLHTVPSVSLFQTPSTSTPASPCTPASTTTPTAIPSGPLLYTRFSEAPNPRRIPMPARAPSTPGLTHTTREMLRIQLRSSFSQFFKTMQFTCNDTEKCLVYGYSDATCIKVPWNVPLERALRQLWKQVLEYDAACGNIKPESQGKRELATYHAVAMALTSSDLPSEMLCMLWDKGLAFSALRGFFDRMSGFNYKKVLVTGATSGIGKAFAERLVKEGIAVVVTGRREDRLKAFVEQNGGDYEAFDLAKLGEIPQFVAKVTEKHPDIDAVVLNSGIQRGFNFTKPESVKLDVINEEVTVNYLSYVHLTTAFLPFLQKKDSSALIYVGSVVGLVPFARCLNYCATKAALHQFVLSLRNQLKDSPIQVLEILPPAVQTELHDEVHQPDIKDGGKLGMPIDEFTEETWNALIEGNEHNEFPIGFGKVVYKAIETPRRTFMQKLPQAPADI